MAQIIKHRRGSLESISGATKRAGELLVVTGSAGISAVNGSSLLFVGIDGSTATPANKVLQGTSVPNLSGAGYDTSIDGIPFYDTAAQKLYILNKGGNLEVKATANTGGTGIVSSSAQVTELLPVGTVSGSSQVVGILSSLNTFSGSQETKNSTLATYTQSVDADLVELFATASNHEGRVDALEAFSSSLGAGFITEAELASATGALEQADDAIEGRLNNIEGFTSSIDTTIKTKLNVEGVISGSSQVNADSITNFDTNVKDKLNVDGVISGSSQVNADSITNFDDNVKDKLNVDGVISGSSQVQIDSVNGFTSFSSSVDSRLDTIEDSLGGAGSIGSRVSSLEAFSSSQESKDSTLETYTASVDGRLDNLESFSSSQEDLNATFATTGSNVFQGTQTITGSLYITNDLVVYGSSSLLNVTASRLDLGDNTIVLNTATPAIRFAGIDVIDSGSTQATGSFYWDSLRDHWLYVHPSGSTEGYNSAVFIAGPRNTGSLGDESTLTENYIPVAQGEDHIMDSIMTQNVGATKITIGGALDVNGAVSASSIVGIGNVSAFSQSVDSRLDVVEAAIGGGSNIDSRLTSLEGFSGSQETKNATLETYTASVDSHISAINSFSASQESKDSTLATYTASVDSRLNQLSTDSGSQASRLTALESFTSSLDDGFVSQAELASATGALETADTAQQARLTSLEGFSGSQETKNSTLATYTASVDSRLNQLSTDSGSQASRLSSIEGFTSSIDTTIKTKLNVETVVSSSAQIVTLLSNQATDFGTGRVSADSIGNVDGTSTITGSFVGDGSGLTGLVTTLEITGSNGVASSVDLLTQGLTFTTASGQGLGIAVSGQTVTFSNVNASTSVKGVASFDSDDFSDSSGNISIKLGGVRATNLNADVAGTGLSLDGVDNSLEVDYGSTAGTSVEGNTNLTIQGTANEIQISSGSVTLGAGGTVTIGLPDSVTIATASIQNNLSVGNNLTVVGNLYVQGSTTTVDSTTIQLGDNIIELNGTGGVNAGLLVKDPTAPNTVSGSLLWDTTNDYWKGGALGSEKEFARYNSTQTSGSVQVVGANGLLVNSTITDNGVDVSITNDLTIGGLTANSFLVADGAKTLTAVAAVNAGDLIQWNGSSFVASSTIDGGTF
jgi:hypothetical protein